MRILLDPIVTDEEIITAFNNTNFGRTDYRAMLKEGLLKVLVGYHCGFTITTIMKELDLVTPNYNVTAKGRWYLFYHCVGNDLRTV